MVQRRVLGGRYELTSPIGRGGMGEVWAGYDTRLDRRVAVKLLRPETLPIGADAQLLAARFAREARLTARLEHSGVPAVFDAGSDSGDLYLVMQLVAGQDLADVIAERGALPVAWAVAIAAQVATVLAAAHAVSLVHRDLKPRNIMLGPDGTVTVLDFGIAALLDPELTALTAAGETLGSPAYMAPEQALYGTAGPQSDLYSLGCVLHELLAGQQLFTAEAPYALMHKHVEQAPQPLRQVRSDVPAAVERLVLDLLAKEPEQRPADALAVHQRLLPFLPQPGSGSSSAPAPMDPTRPYRYPLDPRRCVGTRSPADMTPQVAADVDRARQYAMRLIDEGRFTQAAEILADAVAVQTRHGDAEQVRELRLDLACALILGGDYRRALPEYRTLIAELTETRGAAAEIVLHCRNQAAICAAQIGEVSTALRDFRALLVDQRRVLGADNDRVLELRRQVGLLEASSGDVSSARRTLGALERDLHRLRGPRHPDAHELAALLAHLRQLDGGDETGSRGRSRRL